MHRGRTHLHSIRDPHDLAEITFARRSVLCGIAFRKPNPRTTLHRNACPRITANPLGLPIGGFEQTHPPASGRAPCRGLAVLIPGLDFPEALGVGSERFARIGDLVLFRGFDFFRIPQVTFVALQALGRGSHENPIGGLPLATKVGLQHPSKPRRCHIHTKRVRELFATQ